MSALSASRVAQFPSRNLRHASRPQGRQSPSSIAAFPPIAVRRTRSVTYAERWRDDQRLVSLKFALLAILFTIAAIFETLL